MQNESYAAAVAEQTAAEVKDTTETEIKTADDAAEKVVAEENPQPAEEVKEDAKPKKSGEQRRIDRLTREKYELKAALDYERKMREQLSGNQQSGEAEFNQSEIDAIVERKLAEREAQMEAQSYEQKRDSVLAKAEAAGDFDADDFLENTPVTKTMADAILDGDAADKVVVFLYNNPDEAERIAELPAARQAAEIGKLEAKLAEAKPVKKTNAPAPVKPLGGSQAQPSGYYAEMSDSEFDAMRRKGKIF